MNYKLYQNWILDQIKTGMSWQDIIYQAIIKFDNEIPDKKPKLLQNVYSLFLCLSEELDTPEEINSMLLDIMLYCEGEDTGFYNPYTKEALLGELKSLIEKHNQQ